MSLDSQKSLSTAPAAADDASDEAEPIWLSVDDCADNANVRPMTVLSWIKKGLLPAARFGKQYRIAFSEWVAFGTLAETTEVRQRPREAAKARPRQKVPRRRVPDRPRTRFEQFLLGARDLFKKHFDAMEREAAEELRARASAQQTDLAAAFQNVGLIARRAALGAPARPSADQEAF
jgi:excisionase family DNA binding protein